MEIGGYRIVGELGRGGMGVVYAAVDPRSQRRVALKTVGFQGQQISRRGLERLQREADALTRLQHPGVVPCYGSGVEPRGFYVAMALVEGISLEALLEREGPLPLGRALRIMEDVGDALLHVHRAGLLHRDLKPANVLLSSSGRVVLTDFGLVKSSPELHAVSQASLTRSGTMLGTPGYMPPEQAFGQLEQVGTASDVYGWAATLYALLAGRPPREGQTLIEVLAGFDRPVRSLRAQRKEVPAWLDALLARCLANDPGERPGLDEALRTLRGFGREAPRAGRGRAQVLVALALAVLGVLGVGLVWVAVEPGAASTDVDPPPEGADAGASQPPPRALEFDRLIKEGELQRGLALAQAWVAEAPDSGWALGAALQACVSAGRFEEAADYGERVVALRPDDGGAWTFYANALLRLERAEPGLRAASRAYALQPEVLETIQLYVVALRMAGRSDEALQVLSRGLEGSDGAGLRVDRAELLRTLGRPRDALADLEAALAGDPDDSIVLFRLGLLKLEDLGDPSGELDLLRALERGLRPERVANPLGELYVRTRKQPQTMLAFLDRWLPETRDPVTLAWRAESLLELQRGEEALRVTEALRAADSTAVHVILNARALGLVGRVEEALRLLESVYTQVPPGDADGYCLDAARRASFLALQKLTPGRASSERALRALERWVQAAPGDFEGLGMRIGVLAALDRFDEALAEIERVAPLAERIEDPELTAPFYYTWAEALARSGRPLEALPQLTRSLASAPTAISFRERARYLAMLGLGDDLARVDLLCSLELEPRGAKAWYLLMGVASRQRDKRLAALAAAEVLAWGSQRDGDEQRAARELLGFAPQPVEATCAGILLESGDPKAARTFARRWLGQARGSRVVRRVLVLVNLELGLGAEALEAARRFEQPGDVEAQLLLGRAEGLAGQTDAALTRLEAIYRGSASGDVRVEAARHATLISMRARAVERMLAAAEVWIELAPRDLEARVQRISAWVAAGKHAEVLAEAERVEGWAEGYGDAVMRGRFSYFWAAALLATEQRVPALFAYTRTLRDAPTAYAFLDRGRTLFQLDEYAAAEADYWRALTRLPALAYAWYDLMRLYRATGRDAHARFAAQRVLQHAEGEPELVAAARRVLGGR